MSMYNWDNYYYGTIKSGMPLQHKPTTAAVGKASVHHCFSLGSDQVSHPVLAPRTRVGCSTKVAVSDVVYRVRGACAQACCRNVPTVGTFRSAGRGLQQCAAVWPQLLASAAANFFGIETAIVVCM